MRTRTYFRPSLTSVLLIAAVSTMTLATAAPPKGKGGGGGGGGGEDPSPFTYMIQWLPTDFRGTEFNDSGDMIGRLDPDGASGSIPSVPSVFHNGVLYDMNELIGDASWFAVPNGISNRSDGIFFVAGIGLHDGETRGFRLKLLEGVDGNPPVALEMIEINVLPGHIKSSAGAVNSIGDVVGFSFSNSSEKEPFLYVGSTLNNAGAVLGNGEVYHYEGKTLVTEPAQGFILIPVLP